MISIATTADIPQIQFVRNAVKENRLSDPALVPDKDVEEYIHQRGKGWVFETEGTIVGFSIVSLQDKNVWALFVHPDQEGKGIGQQLHDVMMHWYFSQTQDTVWLSTAPGSRAEGFYRKNGWQATRISASGEIVFEMEHQQWQRTS
jgi:GNAT superfamily N-acetyltransferase